MIYLITLTFKWDTVNEREHSTKHWIVESRDLYKVCTQFLTLEQRQLCHMKETVVQGSVHKINKQV